MTPSDTPIAQTAANHTIPRWSAWTWLDECIGSADGCREKIYGNSPYTGYAAFIRVRDPIVGTTALVSSPAYRVGPVAIPDRMRAGTTFRVNVSVQNVGRETWPSNGTIRPGTFVHM